VANAFVFGDGKPYNVVLVVPNLSVLEKFTEEFKISIPVEDLLENKGVSDLLVQEMGNHLRKKFGGYEVPRKMAFVKEDFSIENGMLTQTLKVKRRVVIQKYQDLLDSLYRD
jgi:long-chain acyl-CoA synthetase